MASITIFDREYPLAYTVAAQSEIAKKFGGIEKIELAFNPEDAAAMMENMAFCAAVMAKAYEDRERVKSKTMGNEYAGRDIPTAKDIAAAVEPKDVLEIAKKIMEAIKEGNNISVEVEPKKGKNAGATP